MYIQNLLAATDIRQRHHHLAVETARALQSGIQYIRTVGSGNYNHGLIALETIHLHQQLVQGLLALVVTAAQTGTTLTTDRINLINKDDARCVFLGLLEHIAHTASTDADKHFHEIGTGNTEEWHLCFAGNRFGQQGFTGTGATGQQNTTRHTSAQALIAVGGFQVINDFLHFFFGFITTGYIGKSHPVGVFIQQFGTAFAE